MDLSELPQDFRESILREKETVSFYTGIDGDMIHYSVEAKRKFRCEIGEALINLLTLEEFRRIDDTYLSYLDAERSFEGFENSFFEGPEKEAIAVHEALENAVSATENQIREVLAQILKRPELGE